MDQSQITAGGGVTAASLGLAAWGVHDVRTARAGEARKVLEAAAIRDGISSHSTQFLASSDEMASRAQAAPWKSAGRKRLASDVRRRATAMDKQLQAAGMAADAKSTRLASTVTASSRQYRSGGVKLGVAGFVATKFGTGWLTYGVLDRRGETPRETPARVAEALTGAGIALTGSALGLAAWWDVRKARQHEAAQKTAAATLSTNVEERIKDVRGAAGAMGDLASQTALERDREARQVLRQQLHVRKGEAADLLAKLDSGVEQGTADVLKASSAAQGRYKGAGVKMGIGTLCSAAGAAMIVHAIHGDPLERALRIARDL